MRGSSAHNQSQDLLSPSHHSPSIQSHPPSTSSHPNSYAYSSSEDTEQIRRAVSSPHLNNVDEYTSTNNNNNLRMRLRSRARSGSASSSSTSLTATEDNYNRYNIHNRNSHHGHGHASSGQGTPGGSGGTDFGHGHGYGYGYAYGQGLMNSTPASIFPYAVPPPLWPFTPPSLAPPHGVAMNQRGGVSNNGNRSRGMALAEDRDRDGEREREISSGSDENVGEDREEDGMMFMSRASSSTTVSLGSGDGGVNSSVGVSTVRQRRKSGGSSRRRDKDGGLVMSVPPARVVTTAKGQLCAGETETEADESPIRLPTSRNVDQGVVITLSVDLLVQTLFEVTRFLSIIPATFGAIYNIHHAFYPPPSSKHINLPSIDFVVCALWAILTGIQCLALTTGLLSRWKAYYATPSILVRLVALQAICWPATHFTLRFFEHEVRPVLCWVLIGTTTCLSRSVQLWVTSNLYYSPDDRVVERKMGATGAGRIGGVLASAGDAVSGAIGVVVRAAIGGDGAAVGPGSSNNGGRGMGMGGKIRRAEGKLGPRRWDWAEVVVKCAVPAGVLYFVTVWAMLLKDELVMKKSGVCVGLESL